MKGWFAWTLLGAVVLSFLQAVTGALLMPAQPAPPGALPWWLASNLLVASIGAWLARRSPAPRPLRMALVFVVLFGIPANSLAELFLFDLGIPHALVLRWYVQDLIVSAAVAAVLGWPRAAQGTARRPPTGSRAEWLARVAAGAAAYVVAYLTAGRAIYPWIAFFYESRHLPGLAAIVPFQVLRGLGFLAVAWAIVRLTDGTRWHVAVRVGVTLSIVGGVAPLLVPNPYMPAFVRYAHMVETGTSNLLFGLFVGWLLAPTPSSTQTEHGRFAA